MNSPEFFENEVCKTCRSDGYNFDFDKRNGFFARWGEDIDDDPQFSPFSPELLDVELTTSCFGPNPDGKTPCQHCYKSNGPNGTYMNFETFKKILDKIYHPCVTQIAYGLDATATNNPDLEKILAYTRERGIVPNLTVARLDEKTADMLLKYVGAIAVSRYENPDWCYDTVKMLTDKGLKQCNCHCLASAETTSRCFEVLLDMQKDSRLSKLNACVFLSLKRKGRGISMNPMEPWYFDQLVKYAMDHNLRIGFDSCSCGKAMETLKNQPNFDRLRQVMEPCEAFCMSSYCDVHGRIFPCSFCPDTPGWEEGINVLECQDMKNLWEHPKVLAFRQKLLDNRRRCPIYDI